MSNETIGYLPKKVLYIVLTKGMDEVLLKLNLQWTATSRSRTGNAPLKVLSIRDYEKHFRGLILFFCMIGDYESLLMLQDCAPHPFCPSMSAESITLFIQRKGGEHGEPLLDASSKPVKDVLGIPVLIDGGWNDPKNVKQFNSALVAIHAANNQREQYEEKCDVCIAMEATGAGHQGCHIHRGNPCIWRKGCPKESNTVENAVKRSTKDGESYEPNGDSPITPFELLKIRTRLLSSNDISDL